jgi:alpha-glucoside transport system substrate-binding protein
MVAFGLITFWMSYVGGQAHAAGTVTVVGVMGEDQIRPIFDEFTDQSGIDVEYIQDESQETLRNCVGENCPDFAIIPWPGLMVELCSAGKLVDMYTFVDTTTLESNYTQSWIDLGTVQDELCGIWVNSSNKSLIWYDPGEFSANGWMTPTTWTEAMTLSDVISDAGKIPWTVGAEFGFATGWPLTDWFENFLLREAGPDFYDELVLHTQPWTATEVMDTLDYFAQLFGEESYQLNGKSGTLDTNVTEAAGKILEDPPEAYLYSQGIFAQDWFDGDYPSQTAGVDYDVIPFPEVTDTYTNAVMGGGDLGVMLRDNNDTRSLVNFLISTDGGEAWARNGFLSPNRNVDYNEYPKPTLRKAAMDMANADIFRFDLTDQLPFELNVYVWQRMSDLVTVAPTETQMYDVMADIEAYALQFQQVVEPGVETTFHYTSTAGLETVIELSAGAVTETTLLQHTPLDSVGTPGGFQFAGRAFNLLAYQDGELVTDYNFAEAVTITLTYSDSELTEKVEDTLMLKYWDGSGWSTDGITIINHDQVNNIMVVTIEHLTDFALIGEQDRVLLPFVRR